MRIGTQACVVMASPLSRGAIIPLLYARHDYDAIENNIFLSHHHAQLVIIARVFGDSLSKKNNQSTVIVYSA